MNLDIQTRNRNFVLVFQMGPGFMKEGPGFMKEGPGFINVDLVLVYRVPVMSMRVLFFWVLVFWVPGPGTQSWLYILPNENGQFSSFSRVESIFFLAQAKD